MTTITLHTLSPKTPHAVKIADIAGVLETRFGGCGIVFANKSHPLHFWESRDQVLSMMAAGTETR